MSTYIDQAEVHKQSGHHAPNIDFDAILESQRAWKGYTTPLELLMTILSQMYASIHEKPTSHDYARVPTQDQHKKSD
jgi:hypothetical protein